VHQRAVARIGSAARVRALQQAIAEGAARVGGVQDAQRRLARVGRQRRLRTVVVGREAAIRSVPGSLRLPALRSTRGSARRATILALRSTARGSARASARIAVAVRSARAPTATARRVAVNRARTVDRALLVIGRGG